MSPLWLSRRRFVAPRILEPAAAAACIPMDWATQRVALPRLLYPRRRLTNAKDNAELADERSLVLGDSLPPTAPPLPRLQPVAPSPGFKSGVCAEKKKNSWSAGVAGLVG